MGTAAQPAVLQARAERGAAIFLSRQPVVDDRRRVTGYRVAYAADEQGAPADAESSTTRLFGDILSVVGLEELVGEALAHLPVSRRLLLTLGVPPVRPDQVVLRVTHADATDGSLSEVLEGLASRGYALSLYELPAPEIDPDLLKLFGVVELDPAAWEQSRIAAAVSTVLAHRGTPLAVGVPDDAAYDRAKALGFARFAGPFYASPRATKVRDVPVGGLAALTAVARMQGGEADIDELVRLIDHDLGLSVKLLRYINSAYFGMRSKITSIRQAVMMLGARGVSRWAMMIALTSGPSAPIELSTMALTRARMCELLAAMRDEVPSDEMFTIGLLSLADALLDSPLERVLGELPLAEEVAAALLERSGPAGAILTAVTSYEIGAFHAPSLQPYGKQATVAYREALSWARHTASGLASGDEAP